MAKEYNIDKTAGQCVACEKPIAPGQELMATVAEGEEELLRQDYCLECWQADPQDDSPALLGVWRTRVPTPKEKTRLLVDDELLVNFFQRLEGTDVPARINFRFVLALVLMRKRLLVYDRGKKHDDGTETWTMHLRGDQTEYAVTDPNMDEEKIAVVSRQLGEIMEGEL